MNGMSLKFNFDISKSVSYIARLPCLVDHEVTAARARCSPDRILFASKDVISPTRT